MKKIIRIYLLPVFMILAATSCKKSFEELTVNNNVPTNVPASLLLTGIENSMAELPGSQKEIIDQYYLYNYDYYGNNRYDLGEGDNYYSTLKNVTVMEAQATKAGLPAVNPYSAMAKFFKAYLFSKMSLEEGDIPMTQALQGLANLNPVYDSQKDVMVQSLKWLDEANTDLGSLITAGGNTLTGDFYFAGDLSKWQKTVNAFRIRLLLQLSKRTADVDVVAQFATMIGNPTKYPMMTGLEDNFQYTYLSPTNYYTMTPDNFGQNGSRENMSSTYVGLLTDLKDPRVYVTSEPARDLVDNKKQSPTAFSSFVGADPGLDLGIMYNNAGLQKYSFINRKRYYSTFTGEPSIQVGYPELMFNIAGGINRGWASGNAEDYYKKGIQASFSYYGIPTGTGTFTAYFYRPGSTSTQAIGNYDTFPIAVNFDTYYAQPAVKYAAGNDGITKILEQKYLALFRHSGLESYFTYRRTGIPDFSTGTGTGNGGRIALRFKYPDAERTSNTDNYNAALTSQFGGNDDINGVMWILK